MAVPPAPVGDRAVAGAGRDEDHRGGRGTAAASIRSAGSRGKRWGAVERSIQGRRYGRFVRGDAGMVGRGSPHGSAARPNLFAAQGELPTNKHQLHHPAHDGFTLNEPGQLTTPSTNHSNGEANADGARRELQLELRRRGPHRRRRRRVPAGAGQIKNLLSLLMAQAEASRCLAGRRRVSANSQGPATTTATARTSPVSLARLEPGPGREKETTGFHPSAFNPAPQALPQPCANRSSSPEPPQTSPLPARHHVARHPARTNPAGEDPNARVLACTYGGFDGDPDLHLILNMYHLGLDFELPEIPGRRLAPRPSTRAPAPGPDDILPARTRGAGRRSDPTTPQGPAASFLLAALPRREGQPEMSTPRPTTHPLRHPSPGYVTYYSPTGPPLRPGAPPTEREFHRPPGVQRRLPPSSANLGDDYPRHHRPKTVDMLAEGRFRLRVRHPLRVGGRLPGSTRKEITFPGGDAAASTSSSTRNWWVQQATAIADFYLRGPLPPDGVYDWRRFPHPPLTLSGTHLPDFAGARTCAQETGQPSSRLVYGLSTAYLA